MRHIRQYEDSIKSNIGHRIILIEKLLDLFVELNKYCNIDSIKESDKSKTDFYKGYVKIPFIGSENNNKHNNESETLIEVLYNSSNSFWNIEIKFNYKSELIDKLLNEFIFKNLKSIQYLTTLVIWNNNSFSNYYIKFDKILTLMNNISTDNYDNFLISKDSEKYNI